MHRMSAPKRLADRHKIRPVQTSAPGSMGLFMWGNHGASEEELAVTAAAKERKDSNSAELARQNASQRDRLRSRTDNNLMDEAAASEMKRSQESAAQLRRNKEMRDKVAGAGLRTDANIVDEAAGIARLRMRSQSKVRQAFEQRELARQNIVQTDTSIDDEEAGRMRAIKAEAGRRRRAQAAAATRANALALQVRIIATKSATDDYLDDEDVGRWRYELAESHEMQRQQHARLLAKKNLAMRKKLVGMPPRVMATPTLALLAEAMSRRSDRAVVEVEIGPTSHPAEKRRQEILAEARKEALNGKRQGA